MGIGVGGDKNYRAWKRYFGTQTLGWAREGGGGEGGVHV